MIYNFVEVLEIPEGSLDDLYLVIGDDFDHISLGMGMHTCLHWVSFFSDESRVSFNYLVVWKCYLFMLLPVY